jgi:Tfp pilus assembly protein PilO
MALKDKIQSTRRTQAQLAFAIVVGAVAAYFFFVRPMAARIEAARIDGQKVAKELAVATQRAGQLPELTKRVNTLRLQVDRFKSMRPAEDFQAAYKEFGEIASANRLNDYNFAPSGRKSIEGGFEHPIAITFNSDFNDAFEFVGRLEQMDRLSRLRSMQITSRAGRQGEVAVKLGLSLFFAE